MAVERRALTFAALAVLAAALRVRALFTDFWFDEIRSYEEFARRARSISDIFFGPSFKHDNNHHLNTVILYLLRNDPGWIIYRLPPFIAGVLLVMAATAVGSRRGRVEGVLAGLLVAGSFTMVVYSTEARGYALVLVCALLAFVALRRYLDAPTTKAAVVFWVWVILGMASHSSISHFYLGALLWSGYRLRQRPKDLVRLHVVPIVCGSLWAAFVLWGARIGGGDPWSWRQVADESLAWTLGYPLSVVPAAAALALALVIVLWDARRLWIEGSDEGLFFVGVTLGPPLLVTGLGPPWLFPRYFLMSLLFLLLILARMLARVWRGGNWRRGAVAAIVVLFFAGNLRYIVPFSQHGRGGASQAVTDIVLSSPDHEILVTSRSVDIRSTLPIAFFERKLGLGDRIRYVPWQALAQRGRGVTPIEWVIDQREPGAPAPDRQIKLPNGETYVLRQSYPADGPSAISWFLYQREP